MALINATFMSTSLMRTVSFSAVLPCDTTNFIAGTECAKPPYKTLYLLHGIYGSNIDWLMDTQIHRLAKEYQIAVIMPSGEIISTSIIRILSAENTEHLSGKNLSMSPEECSLSPTSGKIHSSAVSPWADTALL